MVGLPVIQSELHLGKVVMSRELKRKEPILLTNHCQNAIILFFGGSSSSLNGPNKLHQLC